MNQSHPLSPVQQGMLFHYYTYRNRDYLEQMICEIYGALDIDLFRKSLQKLVEIHDSLRTIYTFNSKEEMRQIIVDAPPFHLEFRDFSKYVESEKHISRYAAFDAEKNLDLSTQTIRCYLFKISSCHYTFLCTYHHIIMDSWAILLFQENFCEIYYRLMTNTPASYFIYSYTLYLNWIEKQDTESARQYWKHYLLSCKNMRFLDIPLAIIRRYKTAIVCIDPENIKLIGDISSCNRVTLNSVIFACWAAYYLDHLNKKDMLIGCVTSGRMINLKHIDKIAGLFVNAVPVYINISKTVQELLLQVQKDILSSSGFSYISLSEIMGAGNLRPGHISSFVNFSIDAEKIETSYSEKLPFRVDKIRYNEQSNYDVYVDIYFSKTKFDIAIHYNVENHYFDEPTIKQKLTRIIHLFKSYPLHSINTIINDLITDESLDNSANFNFVE